jgi:hypothetical protein
MRILQELLAGKIGVRLIFLSGFILTYLAFFPGLMTSDSDFQLVQARSFEFSDWHPVIMSWIWSLTNFALAGPAGFFILLLSMYWFAFFLLSEYFRNRSMVAYLVSLLIPVLPVVVNFSGTLWKDVLVFDCFLLALAIAVHSFGGRRTPLGIFVVTLGLLTIGTLARYNSLLAAVPIFCILLIRSDYSKPVTIFGVGIRMLLSCAIVLTAFVAGNILIDRLLTPQATHPVGQIFLFDLVGVSQRIETICCPECGRPKKAASFYRHATNRAGGIVCGPSAALSFRTFSSAATGQNCSGHGSMRSRATHFSIFTIGLITCGPCFRRRGAGTFSYRFQILPGKWKKRDSGTMLCFQQSNGLSCLVGHGNRPQRSIPSVVGWSCRYFL